MSNQPHIGPSESSPFDAAAEQLSKLTTVAKDGTIQTAEKAREFYETHVEPAMHHAKEQALMGTQEQLAALQEHIATTKEALAQNETFREVSLRLDALQLDTRTRLEALLAPDNFIKNVERAAGLLGRARTGIDAFFTKIGPTGKALILGLPLVGSVLSLFGFKKHQTPSETPSPSAA